MPIGWAERPGNRLENEGVRDSYDAQNTHMRFEIDLEEKALVLTDKDSGKEMFLRPDIKGGHVDLSRKEQVNAGWRAPIVDGLGRWLYLVDWQRTRIAEIMPEIDWEGMGIVVAGIPVLAIPADGNEWRPKDMIASGSMLPHLTPHIQAKDTDSFPGENVFQAEGVPGSVAIYRDVVNNITYKDGRQAFGMSGKIGQMFALCVGWSGGQVTGWAFGRLEKQAGGRFAKVFDIGPDFWAGMTRRGIGLPNTVSVSIDYGYTTIGSSSGSTGDTGKRCMDYGGAYVLDAEYTIDSLSVYLRDVGATLYELEFGLYEYGGASGNWDYVGAKTGQIPRTSTTAWYTKAPSAPITLGPRGNLRVSYLYWGSSSSFQHWDNQGTGSAGDGPTWTSSISQKIGTDFTGMSDQAFTRVWSAYMTLTEVAGGIIPQIMHHRQLQRRR